LQHRPSELSAGSSSEWHLLDLWQMISIIIS